MSLRALLNRSISDARPASTCLKTSGAATPPSQILRIWESGTEFGQTPDAQQTDEVEHSVLLVSVVSARGLIQQAGPVVVPDRVDRRAGELGEFPGTPGHVSSSPRYGCDSTLASAGRRSRR
jgi:hypothetical protein